MSILSRAIIGSAGTVSANLTLYLNQIIVRQDKASCGQTGNWRLAETVGIEVRAMEGHARLPLHLSLHGWEDSMQSSGTAG